MPLGVQKKLLSRLQKPRVRPIRPAGAKSLDVRIIATSHRDLSPLVAEGKFLVELFDLLNQLQVEVPALRDRSEDIPRLVHHFMGECSQRLGKTVSRIQSTALDDLCSRPWPDNVRQLESVVERGVVLAQGELLTRDLLPSDGEGGPTVKPCVAAAAELELPLAQARAQFEHRYLSRALSRAGGNLARAARASGVDRTNFRRMLRRHGLR
jgi:DNA-binding NtrC family response regulator